MPAVWPNPVTGPELMLYGGSQGIDGALLRDISGRTIASFSLKAAPGVTLSLQLPSGLAPGFYIMHFSGISRVLIIQ